MQKFNLSIQRILGIKLLLEEEINNHDKEIVKLSKLDYNESEEFSIKEIEHDRDKKSAQLIKLHVVLSFANAQIKKNQKVCNNENIKTLSEIKRKLAVLKGVRENNANTNGKRMSSKDVMKKKTVLINKESLINKEISKFNKETLFEVEIDQSIIDID